jgi:HEAT repeat protein
MVTGAFTLSRIVRGFSLAVLISAPCCAEPADTSKLLDAATNNRGQERIAAIDDLGEQHELANQVVPQLRKLLRDRDSKVRWHAARALGDYGVQAKDAVGDIRRLLSDSDPIVQYHAAVALGKLEDKSNETVEALVSAATSKDGRVARAAIAALKNLKPGPKRTVAALKRALESNDDAVNLYAMEAIVEQKANAVPLLNGALSHPKTAPLACTAIEQIGPDAAGCVPELTAILGKTKHSQMLIQTLLALASIGPAANSAESKVLPLLEHETDATVRVAAAYALGSIDAKNADHKLKNAAAKDDAFLSMMASWALAKIHPDDVDLRKAAVEKLVHGMKNKDPMFRTAAARSLQSLHAPPEVVAPVLVEVVNDPDPDVQANVINAVAGLGESVVPRVVNALQNPQFKRPAIRVLKKLGPKASAAVDPLIRTASDSDAATRADIFLALAAIGPGAARATDMLAKAISSKDDAERESALFALRKIGPGARDAVKPLMERMKADDSFASIASAWALTRIAPDNDEVVSAVVPKLSRGLTNKDEQIRLQSVEAIGDLGKAGTPVAPNLQRAAKEDSSEVVRAAAEAVLKRVKS